MMRWLTTSTGTMTLCVSMLAVPPATKFAAAAAVASELVYLVVYSLALVFTLSSVVR